MSKSANRLQLLSLLPVLLLLISCSSYNPSDFTAILDASSVQNSRLENNVYVLEVSADTGKIPNALGGLSFKEKSSIAPSMKAGLENTLDFRGYLAADRQANVQVKAEFVSYQTGGSFGRLTVSVKMRFTIKTFGETEIIELTGSDEVPLGLGKEQNQIIGFGNAVANCFEALILHLEKQ